MFVSRGDERQLGVLSECQSGTFDFLEAVYSEHCVHYVCNDEAAFARLGKCEESHTRKKNLRLKTHLFSLV